MTAASLSPPKSASSAKAGKFDTSSLSGLSATSVSDNEQPQPTQRLDNDNSSNTSNLEKLATIRSNTSNHNNNDDLPTVQRTLTRQDGSEYPSGAKLGLIVLALCLAVFLMALDNAIITTAIPKISDNFNSLADVGWYGSAYLLTQASLQLLFGRFYTFLSIKWTFLACISIFEVGSLLCGVAPNSVTLIVGRAVAGIGAAGIFSGGLLILAHSVPLAKRPLYTGLIGGMYGVASVAGPLLGGVFTDHITWRWCFYINLPVGAVTLLVIAIFYQDPHREAAAGTEGGMIKNFRKFDPLGNAIFMPAVICLLLALQWGGVQYAWNSPRIIALFVVFGVLISVFIGIQFWAKENATLPIRILTHSRSVWSAGFFSFTNGAAFFIFIYYVPLWFQAVQGVTAVESGIRNLPMLLANIIGSVGAGVLVTTFGYYAPFMIGGTVFASIGAGLMTTWNPASSTGAWMGYQVLIGFGVGIGIQQPLMAVQTVLPLDDIPTGTALVIFLQSLGGALFVAVGQTVFTNKLAEEVVARLPAIDPALVLASGATNLKVLFAGKPEELAIAIGAYSTALTTAFLVGAGLASASIIGSAVVEWKSVKGKNVEAGMA